MFGGWVHAVCAPHHGLFSRTLLFITHFTCGYDNSLVEMSVIAGQDPTSALLVPGVLSEVVMTEDDANPSLTTLLLRCEWAYQKLVGLIPDASALSVSSISEEQAQKLKDMIIYLAMLIQKVEELETRAKLGDVFEDIDHGLVKFYRREVLQNKDCYLKLLPALLDRCGVEYEEVGDHFESSSNPVWNIFATGIDWSREMGEPGLLDAERLCYSEFFDPDEWLRNLGLLQPVVGRDPGQRLPGHIRIRLRELYRSFILGNYLAAIALARAILEYSLVDRAAKNGLNPLTDDPRAPGRRKRLRQLVQEAAAVLPDLEKDMEEIITAGNRALHPKKREKIELLQNAWRDMALSTTKSVKKVVEVLYLEHEADE